LPLPRSELDAAAAAEPLRLLRGDDLRAEALEQLEEALTLARGAGEDDARHAGTGETADLVGGERLPGDVHERLRASAGSVAEPFGLAAGEDDRFHRALRPRDGVRRLRDGVRRRGGPADAFVGEARLPCLLGVEQV